MSKPFKDNTCLNLCHIGQWTPLNKYISNRNMYKRDQVLIQNA